MQSFYITLHGVNDSTVVVMKCVVYLVRHETALTETTLFLSRIETAPAARAAPDDAMAAQASITFHLCHTKHLFPLHRIDRPEISLFSL